MGANMIRKFQNLRFLLIVVFVTKYSERIPVGIHGFRSIIVVETRGISPLHKHRLLPRCPHNFHRRRQVASRGIFGRCRILYDAPSDVLPKDTDVDGFETNDTDDNVATLRSVTFSNLPKDQEPNLLCELLMEYGACASWITDADRYTEFEEPIFHEPPILGNAIPNSSTIEDMLATPWITPVWNQCNVTALFPASIQIPTTVAAIREIYSDIVAVVVDENQVIGESEVDNHSGTTSTTADETASPSKLLESYDIETIPNNKDWVLSVQQSWHPIIINDCFILRFPWHTDHDVTIAIKDHYNTNNNDEAQLIVKKNELIPILLQGGIAFGTGEHATTQLCLQWLHETVTRTLLLPQNQEQQCIRVLDYGAGSGILGIAACAIGQKEQHWRMLSMKDNVRIVDGSSPLVTAIGIDIDIDACRIANANAILNGNVSMRSYLPSFSNSNNQHDDESQSLLMKAHYSYQQQQQQRGATTDQNVVVAMDDIVLSDPSTVLADESFDICVANILAGPLIVLASTLYNYLRPGGKIGMSGILSHQSQMIVETYQNVGFVDVQVRDNMNGWVLVTGQRPFVTL